MGNKCKTRNVGPPEELGYSPAGYRVVDCDGSRSITIPEQSTGRVIPQVLDCLVHVFARSRGHVNQFIPVYTHSVSFWLYEKESKEQAVHRLEAALHLLGEKYGVMLQFKSILDEYQPGLRESTRDLGRERVERMVRLSALTCKIQCCSGASHALSRKGSRELMRELKELMENATEIMK